MNKVIWFIPGVLALVAVLSLVTQFVFPRADLYKDELMHRIENMVDAEISIGSMKTDLRAYKPVIELYDVSISKLDREESLSFNVFIVEIDPFASLLEGHFVIHNIYAKDGEFTLVREKNNEIHAVLPTLGSQEERSFGIHVENATVTWKDLLVGKEYVFKESNLRIKAKRDRQQITFNTRPPDVLGQYISGSANFTGHLQTPNSWQGNFLVAAENLNIAQWLSLFEIDKDYDGKLSLKATGTIEQQQIVWAHGDIRCEQCTDSQTDAINFATEFAWEQDEELLKFVLSDATVMTPEFAVEAVDLQGRKWRASNRLELAVQIPAFNDQQIEALAPYIDILPEELPITTPSGKLSLAVAMPAPRMPASFEWEESVQALVQHDWTAVDAARFSVILEDGSLVLPDSKIGSVQYEKVAVSARWQQTESKRVLLVDNFAVRAEDIVLRGEAGWSDGTDSDADIYLSMDVNNLPLTVLPTWLPLERFNPKFSRWLEKAFIRGTVQQGYVELGGKLQSFPFINSPGRFFWSASVRDMEMNYSDKYQVLKKTDAEVVFNQQTLSATVSKLQHYDMHSDNTLVYMDNVLQPFVEVNGSLRGELGNILTYVKHARLVDEDDLLIRNVRFSGDSHLSFSAGVPLSKKVDRPTQVQGLVEFIQSDFAVPQLNIELNNINGTLNFDKQGGNSEFLELFWNDTRLTGTASATGDTTLLSFEGKLSAESLIEVSGLEFGDFMTGVANWRVDVQIPNLRPKQKKAGTFEIKMVSDLQGSVLHLPVPLQKAATDKQMFVLTISPEESGTNYQFSYSDIVHGWLEKRAEKNYAGHIYFGETPYLIDSERLLISGNIRQPISADDWMSAGGDKERTVSDYLIDTNINFTDLSLGGVSLGKVNLQTKPLSNSRWKLHIDSADVAGEMTVSTRGKKLAVHANMQRLKLMEKGMLAAFSGDDSISSLPKSEILIDQFQYGDLQAEDMVLLLSPLEKGTRVDRLRMNVGDVVLMFEGKWQQSRAGPRSIFDISAGGEDYGEFFASWGISKGFKGGKGRLNGQLSWPGSPQDFTFEKLRGELRLDLKDGVIEQFKPGISRILGLMNVGSVVRRLSLDFQDVFQKGLLFDKLTADLKFDDGNMYTDNFSLTGPSMGLLLKGRTGITDKDYEQQLEVTPNLSSSLPFATALVGGPLAGVSVYLLDKLTNIGDRIDEAVILKYQISGSWDEPNIEFVESVITDNIGTRTLKPLIKRILPKKQEQ